MKKYIMYVLKRLLAMIPILLIVSFAVFFLLRMSGSSELATIIGEKQASDELKARITEEYGLDDPLFLRYINWLKNALMGDFGKEYTSGQDVGQLIVTRIPVTLGLVGISFVVGTLLAILLGVIASLHRNKPIDTIISLIMLFFSSVPGFLICVVTLVIVAKFVPGYSFVGTYLNVSEYFQRIMLPAIIMSLGHLALLGRVTRSSMTSQLQAPYITTANAKGISSKAVTYKHAFHNAVIPVLTVAGNSLAGAIGSTVLIEQIFSLPGIGGLLVSGVQTNNYPVVQILVMLMLTIYLVVSLLVDLLYVIVDPRVSLT